MPTAVQFTGYDCLQLFLVLIRLIDTSENDQVQSLYENLKTQWIMLSTENLFIPSPLCKRPRYYKLGTSKTVRFPRQVAECLTELPEKFNVSQEHFPFSVGTFHLLRSQSAQIHGGNQTKSVYCIPKIGQGRSGFSFKDYCFDNLVKYNISALWKRYELVPFLPPQLQN